MTTNHDSEKSAPDNNDRRKVLKKLAVGTVAVAGCSVLPTKWTSPVVEFGALPAHAVTSGTVTAIAEPATEVATEVATEATSGTEKGLYWGRHNGDRPTWYYGKTMSKYPEQFTVVIDGCSTTEVTSNNGSRFESGSVIVKQSDVSGRGMAVIGSAGCSSRTSHINY